MIGLRLNKYRANFKLIAFTFLEILAGVLVDPSPRAVKFQKSPGQVRLNVFFNVVVSYKKYFVSQTVSELPFTSHIGT